MRAPLATGLATLMLLASSGTASATTQPPGADVVLVVEDSAEAARRDPAGDRWRAVEFMRNLLSPGDRVGVVSYGKHARVVKPLTGPKSDLPAKGWSGPARTEGKSRPMQGLSKALDALEKSGRPDAKSDILLVMSGDAAAEPPEMIRGLVDRARRLGAAVYGFRRPRRSETPQVEEVAKATGGSTQRFKKERQLPMMWQTVFDRWRRGGRDELIDRRLTVDAAVTQVRLMATTTDPEVVVVSSPDGRRFRGSRKRPANMLWSDTPEGAMIVIDKPTPGVWRIEAGGAPVRGWIESDLALIATVPSGKVRGGDRLKISAFLALSGAKVKSADTPHGLTVSATIPDVLQRNSHLSDDGGGADTDPGDGEFWGVVEAPRIPGSHEVVVRASAAGFYRRAVATIEVVLEDDTQAEESVDEPPPPLPARRPQISPSMLKALAGLAGLGLLFLLVALFRELRRRRRRRRDGDARQKEAEASGGAAAEEPDPDLVPLSSSAIDAALRAHLAKSGVDDTSLPSRGPADKPHVIILDHSGDFERRIREAIGDKLALQRVGDARSCRQQVRQQQPAMLVLVDPIKGATVPALLKGLKNDEGRMTLPVIRVGKTFARGTLNAELQAGVSDVMLERQSDSAQAEAAALLKRVARGLRTHRSLHGLPAATPAAPAAPAAPTPPAAPRQFEQVKVPWLADRIEDVPVPLTVSPGAGAGMLVAASAEGFCMAAKTPAVEGEQLVFESDLFRSLSLENVQGKVFRVRRVDHDDFPYLWDVDCSEVPAVHRQRILACFRGLVRG